jgi:hypothetical protein
MRNFIGSRVPADIERLDAHGGRGPARHVRELIAVVADIGDVVGHDQVVLRIGGGLHIVADNGGSRAAGSHGSRVRIGLARSAAPPRKHITRIISILNARRITAPKSRGPLRAPSMPASERRASRTFDYLPAAGFLRQPRNQTRADDVGGLF